MGGKVFSDTVNLYQDQARILFNYYRKAAEKIVREETALEESIRQSQEAIAGAKKKKTTGIILIAVFSVFLPVSIYGLVTLLKARKKIAEEEAKITGYSEAFTDIRRDYQVNKLGVVYVPVATRVPFEDKSFMVDHTGAVENTNFILSQVRKPGELLSTLSELESGMKEVPVVESVSSPEEIDTADYSTSIQHITMYDYVGNIDRQVRNIRYLLKDNDTASLTLPIIMPNSGVSGFLREYATSDTGNMPVLPVFDIESHKEKIDSFYSLNDTKKQFEKNTSENQIVYFKNLIRRLAETAQIVSQLKMNSSGKLLDYSNMIFSMVLKSGFNHYSPALEAEEIERIRAASFNFQDSVDDYTPFTLKSSSRVRYDIFSGSWIAEDLSRTSMPFGMHQIQEEVLMPVIQNLMAENRIERLKIYNAIKDQKIDYLNQWHRDTEDFYGRNRAEANDLINRMQESYADYMSSFNTYKALQETKNSLNQSRSLDNAEVQEQENSAEVIAGFELQANQSRQKQEEFTDFMDRIKDDIDQKASEFGHIEYYEASLRDRESRNIARSTEGLHDLDPRRKKLLAVSPYVAKYAKLPPMPRVEQKLYDDFAINLGEYTREQASPGEPAAEE